MRYFTIALLVLVLGGASSRGQTTQPVESAWPPVVEQLTLGLLENNLAGVQGMLVDRPVIRTFASSDADLSVRKLIERTRGAQLVGYHAYVYPPLVMAADLAADFKNATTLPESVKTPMIPQDDVEMKRANATAVQWIGETLKVKDGELVAVLVLWCTRPALPGVEASVAEESEVVFVLAQGTRTEAGQLRLHQVVYGNPIAGTR